MPGIPRFLVISATNALSSLSFYNKRAKPVYTGRWNWDWGTGADKFKFFNFILVPVGVAGAVGIGLPSAFGSRRVKGLPVLGAYPLPGHLLQC
jgi:hypothetical protein